MEYITVENGTITGHYHSSEAQEADVVEVTDWDGIVGSDVRLYDWENNGILRSQEDLIADGLYEDNRGTWYVCADRSSFEILEIGVKLPDGIEVTLFEPQTKWDEWSGSEWVTNVAAKEEEENRISIYEAQQKVINRLAEAMDGVYKVLLRESATLNLTVPEIAYGNDFRNDYAAWKALE